YDLIHPRTKRAVGRLGAREVFAKIVHGAWKTGEPGVFFVDRANHFNPVPRLGEYEATNPCGEQPLLPYDVCNLGSINVGLFVKNGQIDWEALRKAVHLCTHFLDNVIDANKYPLQEIQDLAQRIRRIGLGLMGWADMLVRLGVPYNSNEAVDLGRERYFQGGQRGTFPEWEKSIWGPDPTCARYARGNRIRPLRALRNCDLTTVAPTGTISIISGCSSGIEPLFAVAFMRNQAGVLMPDVNEDFVATAKREGWYSDQLMKRIAEAGHIHFDEVPEKWQRVFVTAHDVTPEWHIRMQAAFQDYTDSAISKTCNFPESATEADVRRIYELAYQLDCKGVTVYRDNSREQQVLSTGKTAQKVKEAAAGAADVVQTKVEVAELKATIAELEAELSRTKQQLHEVESENLQRRAKRSRPELLRGTTRRLETPLGTLYVTITEDDKAQPFEVFMSLGKAGAALMADVEAIGRLISLALRAGIPIQEVHRQLRGISSDRVTGLGPNKVLSVPDAIGIAIERWLQDKQGVQQDLLQAGPALSQAEPVGRAIRDFEGHAYQVGGVREEQFVGACPDCGSQLEFAEGCVKCHVCGYSECG
ncbi:MAG: adenosylcobalamin-dependent ribonucleoside-diphosphate reductase, partial [Gemmatimonadetes bacterium]|nr:adenosylcobalamin-dependent ribonucleoside-diphosphate reductase [Gemmatimonadota bacterium]